VCIVQHLSNTFLHTCYKVTAKQISHSFVHIGVVKCCCFIWVYFRWIWQSRTEQ